MPGLTCLNTAEENLHVDKQIHFWLLIPLTYEPKLFHMHYWPDKFSFKEHSDLANKMNIWCFILEYRKSKSSYYML